ncbi:hypothetical protein ERJ75_000541900 [Trypanosoma vivax]|nr:hypothetical protein ERJ75_000541900 [Trypanosoma vivax]
MMGLGTATCFWGRLWLLLALCVARCGAGQDKAVTVQKAKAACGVSSALKGSAQWAERLTATLVERSIALRARQEHALKTVKAMHTTCEGTECTHRAQEARTEAENAHKFCVDVEQAARRLREDSATIVRKHRQMAGKIDGMIETLATHNRGAKDGNGMGCVGNGTPEAATQIRQNMADYRRGDLSECFDDNAEEMNPEEFEGALQENKAALTLFDGSSDANAVVAGRNGAEGYCAFFTGNSNTNAVLYSTRSADTDVDGKWGGMWQIAKTNDKNVRLRATGKDNTAISKWKDQAAIAETLKKLREIHEAIRTPSRSNKTTNCLHHLAADAETVKDAALREACSAFDFDEWIAKWTTGQQSTQKSGNANKGAELTAPRSNESANDAQPGARPTHAGGYAGDTRTQSRAAETNSVAAPLLLATTLGLVRAPA